MGVVDLSSEVVVLPGSRAGRRLLELLVSEAEGRGSTVVPPRILTAGAVPELFYRSARPRPPSLVRWRSWVGALQSLSEEELGVLTPRPPRPHDLPGWMALAREFDNLHQELGAELLTCREVASRCGGELTYDDSDRWVILSKVQEGAMAWLEEGGWEDRERARARVLREGRARGGFGAEEVPLPLRMNLVATPELPGVVRRFLARALERSDLPSGWLRVLLLGSEGDEGGFREDGSLEVDVWRAREIPLSGGELRAVGGPVDQGAAAVQAVSRVAPACGSDEVVVSSADPEVFPYLELAFAEAGASTRRGSGRPLRGTPLQTLLRGMAAHLRAGRAESFAALVRHPELEGWFHAGGIPIGRGLSALDRYREGHLPYQVDGRPLEGGRGAGGEESRLVEGLRARLEALLAPFRGVHPLREWGDPVVALLTALYGDRPFREDRLRDRPLLAALERIGAVLDELSADPRVGGSTYPGWGILQLLADLLAQESFPELPTPAAIELLEPLELPLDDAPVLVLAGVNEPHFPSTEQGHPFLPDALRERVGLPGNRARHARDAYLLSAALRGRREWHILCGRRSAGGDPLRPSRLLLTGSPREVALRTRELLAGGGESPRHRSSSPPSAPPLSLPPERALPLPEGAIRVPVSSFGLLLQSPYLWVLNHLYRLRVPESEATELTPLTFGSLLHHALEALARELRSEEREERLAEGLVAHLHDEALRRFGSRRSPALRVQLAQAERRLRRAAEVEAQSRALGWFPVGAELSLPQEGILMEVEGREFRLTGRVDRVDQHREGRWRLLDYKTGDLVKEPERAHRTAQGVWLDLQLPLYAALLGSFESAGGDRLPVNERLPVGESELPDVGYFALPRALADTRIDLATWGWGEIEEAMEVARGALASLAGSEVLHDPNAPLPDERHPLAPLLGAGILRSPEGEDEEGESE